MQAWILMQLTWKRLGLIWRHELLIQLTWKSLGFYCRVLWCGEMYIKRRELCFEGETINWKLHEMVTSDFRKWRFCRNNRWINGRRPKRMIFHSFKFLFWLRPCFARLINWKWCLRCLIFWRCVISMLVFCLLFRRGVFRVFHRLKKENRRIIEQRFSCEIDYIVVVLFKLCMKIGIILSDLSLRHISKLWKKVMNVQ